MFLYVNPTGLRHLLLDTFNDVIDICKNARKSTSYRFSILDAGNPGKYDLIMVYKREELSAQEYVNAYIIHNPNNTDYMVDGFNIRNDNEAKSVIDVVFTGLVAAKTPTYKGKQYNVTGLFPVACQTKGYLHLVKPLPVLESLDNFSKLSVTLDAFFSPTAGTGSNPSTSAPVASESSAPANSVDKPSLDADKILEKVSKAQVE